MAVVVVDRGKLREAVQAVAERIAGMVRPLPDTGIRIPGSEWTVGEAASHLAGAQGLFARLAAGEAVTHGDGTREGLAAANAHQLDRHPDRDGARLADLIEDATRSYLQASAAVPPDFVFHTPMGPMDADVTTSYMLIHLMMHGWPLARALRQPSPFDRDDVHLTMPFVTTVLPRILNRQAAEGFTACYDVVLRGGSRLAFMFDDGALTIADRPTRRVDCHIVADPAAFLLVGSGLLNQWGQIARGKLLTYGRKPWLALKFVSLFSPP